MKPGKHHNEFKVVIDGLALDAETFARIDQAIRKAVLIEMASIDVRGGELAFSPVMAQMMLDAGNNGNGGTTGGVQVKVHTTRA